MTEKIPIYSPNLSEIEREYLLEAYDSGWISSTGEFIQKFENKFKEWNKSKFALTASSGTTALHLALLACGIEKNDEVLIPNITFITTANVVRYVGATPVLVDINFNDWNMDIEDLKKKITSKTKAIIPVHLYGFPAQMQEIMEIASEKELFVIEDSAEALGASIDGVKTGNFGDIGCFSFYGNKVITTGEGGMITTKNEELLQKMDLLKNHGMTKQRRYYHEIVGYNFRMTNMQAAIGFGQMQKIDEIIKRKIEIGKLYAKHFENVDQIQMQELSKGYESVYWLVSINVKNEKVRDDLLIYLDKNGVDARKVFYPISEMPPYKKYFNNSLMKSYEISKSGLNLPSYPDLSNLQIDKIVKDVLKFLNR